MAIVMLRIDDRLIHGQVVTMWTRRLSADTIVVASDAVAKDTFIAKVLRMAAPAGMKVDVLTMEQTLSAFKDTKYDKAKVLLLVKSPEDAKSLLDGGLGVKTVNVGGMGAKAGASSLYKNISASPAQVAILQELTQRGIVIEFQILPDSERVTFDKLAIKK